MEAQNRDGCITEKWKKRWVGKNPNPKCVNSSYAELILWPVGGRRSMIILIPIPIPYLPTSPSRRVTLSLFQVLFPLPLLICSCSEFKLRSSRKWNFSCNGLLDAILIRSLIMELWPSVTLQQPSPQSLFNQKNWYIIRSEKLREMAIKAVLQPYTFFLTCLSKSYCSKSEAKNKFLITPDG